MGEDIEWADGDKRFGDEGGRESIVSRGGARLHSGSIHIGGVRGGSYSVTAGGEAPRVRAAKSSELGQGKL